MDRLLAILYVPGAKWFVIPRLEEVTVLYGLLWLPSPPDEALASK